MNDEKKENSLQHKEQLAPYSAKSRYVVLKKQAQELISKVKEQVGKRLPKPQKKVIKDFVDHYYERVAPEDLLTHSTMDLYGAVVSHWSFLYHRKPDEIKVRVFNPIYEQHGWQSTHTIVEIVHPDMPFLVDSIRMELNRHGLTMHLMINPGVCYCSRDNEHQLSDMLTKPPAKNTHEYEANALIHVEVDRQTDECFLEQLENDLRQVLSDVRLAVADWSVMRQGAADVLTEIQSSSLPVPEEEYNESIAFIEWLMASNFTFLGFREYQLDLSQENQPLTMVPNSGLGLLSDERIRHPSRFVGDMSPEAQSIASSKQKLLVLQQLSWKSTVHRPSQPYYIGIKKFNEKGEVIGENRFIGLFTSAAYHSNPQDVPIIRQKIQHVLDNSGFIVDSYSYKVLLNILESHPRDELFQSSEQELFDIALGIYNMQERRKIRLFMRKDPWGRFFSCFVYVPRDQFNSSIREKMGKILKDNLKGVEITFSTYFAESILARIHFIVRTDPNIDFVDYDLGLIEDKLSQAGRSWSDELEEDIVDYFGEGQGKALYNKYKFAFPAGYRDIIDVRTAVHDIERMESLTEENSESSLSDKKLNSGSKNDNVEMMFYRPLETFDKTLHFKLLLKNNRLALSDVLPMLEHMGLKIISERSFDIRLSENETIYINDFSMHHMGDDEIDVDKRRDIFQSSFQALMNREIENDGFNRLVLLAGIDSFEVAIFRAYAKYFQQIKFTFSQIYIESTLAKHHKIAYELIRLFHFRFNPKLIYNNEQNVDNQKKSIEDLIDKVSSLDEDRILRRYLEIILATIRTSFFIRDSNGRHKASITFKIQSSKLLEMPEPLPAYEFFVYSPRVEGVHLRTSKVARGGLRWSDRMQDFRTEILGLMKAQSVKNAVIVPSGAKGGFICKTLPITSKRELIMAEVVQCYETFISGMLDLTDNILDGKIISPKQVVCHDDEDYYLVVAADKGTATFSDIANNISKKYNFWLGDAFASGGSVGYDHKKMGITAKGAWESVKRNFRELDIDTQTQPITVVGIGDMGGDVFGNGMLLSKCLKVVAAFNHMHIFVDPNPDPSISYQERERLFNLPRSSWADYDKDKLSKGGCIFNRSAKNVRLTSEIKKALAIKEDVLEPNVLIKRILCAPVDLLFNGGIGTYVKAKQETDTDVGDRANDTLRVNGADLQARVVGEGGNLGLTQLGRIEYNLAKGISYTDFIDNAAGVDCSDHEVNIKILLDSIVKNGDLTSKQRDELLVSMTDELSCLVLKNNYYQTQAISLAFRRSNRTLDEYCRMIDIMENNGKLDRTLEYLPDNDELEHRKLNNLGLTRPELSVLLTYSKIILKEELLTSDILDDECMNVELFKPFPKVIGEKFHDQLIKHGLRREIIATQLSNEICNFMGATFVGRLYDETGATSAQITKAFIVAREVFDMMGVANAVELLDNKVPSEIQMEILTELSRLVRRGARWFLRNRRRHLDINFEINRFKDGIKSLNDSLSSILMGVSLENYEKLLKNYHDAGVPHELANICAGFSCMISALDVVESATDAGQSLELVGEIYFAIGSELQLDWFREEISKFSVKNNWHSLARAAYKDDLDRQQRSITQGILQFKDLTSKANLVNEDDSCGDNKSEVMNWIETWLLEHKNLIQRWYYMLDDLKAAKVREFTMFAVALRELLDLAQASYDLCHDMNSDDQVKASD